MGNLKRHGPAPHRRSTQVLPLEGMLAQNNSCVGLQRDPGPSSLSPSPFIKILCTLHRLTTPACPSCPAPPNTTPQSPLSPPLSPGAFSTSSVPQHRPLSGCLLTPRHLAEQASKPSMERRGLRVTCWSRVCAGAGDGMGDGSEGLGMRAGLTRRQGQRGGRGEDGSHQPTS